MNMIRCMITDDEPMARKGLKGYVDRIPYLQLVSICEDALQLKEVLQHQKTDLLFLDIQMPYLSGIQLLQTLTDPPKVILTTAYENYALQGFELDVLDYLLKPISFDRFSKAVSRAADYFASRGTTAPDCFFIKVDRRLEKVFFREILFIEALENYVAIYTAARKMVTHSTLKSVQQQLPPQFIQPHKSYLVNTAHITTVEGNQLHCGSYRIPISKYQKEEVMQLLRDKGVERGKRGG